MAISDLFSKIGLDLWKNEQSILGIDIGSSAIKVVQLTKKKEIGVLETYGEIALGKYGGQHVGQAVKLTDEKVVEALKDIIRESGAKIKNVSVSIPLKSSFVTAIDLPVGEKNLQEIIEIEARRYVPVAISEVHLDWWVIPKDTEVEQESEDGKAQNIKETTRILLVATHKDVVSRYRDIISKAGLEVKAFEIEIFSMIRACVGRVTHSVMVMDLGASSTKMVIVDHGIIRMSHSLNRGSQDLTLALSRSLSIDFDRAEETKREIGLSQLPEHREMVSVMEPQLDYIISEADTMIKDYQKKYNRPVSRVILTGGGALLGGLVEFSVKRFNIEVGLANPFSKVEYPAFLEEVLKKVGPSFSTSLGLAIREL